MIQLMEIILEVILYLSIVLFQTLPYLISIGFGAFSVFMAFGTAIAEGNHWNAMWVFLMAAVTCILGSFIGMYLSNWLYAVPGPILFTIGIKMF